jgi:hypothetical protein
MVLARLEGAMKWVKTSSCCFHLFIKKKEEILLCRLIFLVYIRCDDDDDDDDHDVNVEIWWKWDFSITYYIQLLAVSWIEFGY